MSQEKAPLLMLCSDVTQLPMIVCLEFVGVWTLAQKIPLLVQVNGGEVVTILL